MVTSGRIEPQGSQEDEGVVWSFVDYLEQNVEVDKTLHIGNQTQDM